MARRRRIASLRERVRKNASSTGGTSLLALPEGMDFFREKKGKVTIDILPYEVTQKHPDEVEPGEIWYKRPFWVHYKIGVDENAYICPRSVGQKCPICAYREKLINEDYEGNKEVIDALKPKLRVLYAIRVLNNPNYEEDKVYLWQIAYANFQKQLDREITEGEEEWADFPDPDNGYHLRVRFVEETFNGRKFLKADRIDFIERSEPIPDELLDQVPQLDDLLKILPYKKLEKIFWEGEDAPVSMEEGQDEEAEEKPSPKPKAKVEEVVEEEEEKPRPRRPRKEEDEEAEEKPRPRPRRRDEDEEAEEKPRQRRPRRRDDDEDERKPRRKPRADEEEDEEKPRHNRSRSRRRDEDGEEDEEKPRSKSKAKVEEEEDIPVEGRCPYGHEFGADFEAFADCDTCEMWTECQEAYEKNN